MADEKNYDLGRYETAAGWEPEDPWKKQRDKEREEQEKELGPTDSMLELLSANEWIRHSSRKKPPAELYGPLWREGELAVLLGEPGTGKSILAVQIAEDIARGKRAKGQVTRVVSLNSASRSPAGGLAPALLPQTLTTHHSPLTIARPKAVLYIDFQRNAAQWTERYSVPSPIPGKLPIRHRFSKRFDRAAIDWNLMDPVKFNRDPVKFALHSIFNKIEKSQAKVVIIDDITLGGVALLRPNATARIMQTLKLWAATEGLSILVLAGVSPRVSSPHDSKGLRKNSRLPSPVSRLLSSFTVADSIFSINNSTFGPQYRYVKSLKNSAISTQHPTEVLTYQFSSPPGLGGVDAFRGRGGSSTNFLASQIPSPVSGLSSPVLQYLGPSSEEDHLRDYSAEAERVSSPHVSKSLDQHRKRGLRRLSRESAVEMLMSKEYWRYLEE